MERPDLARRMLMEAIGAFALVVAGCGAIIADTTRDGALGTVGISLVFGLIIMVMVYAGGHLSGAHYNPAVTIAFALARHFPVREAVAYIASQVVGAVAGAGLLLAAWTDRPADLGATVPSVAAGTALLYEVVLTALLMFVITAVATDTRAVGAAAAIAIGGAVGLDALFGGPITGASMNPARSFGPALASGTWTDFWVYVAGPVAGAAIGVFAYELGARPPAHGPASDHERALSMANVLFVCLQNAGRSQMSQALFERAAGGRHAARSAGSRADPAGRVHPEVVEVMRELGIDLAGRRPHRLQQADAEWADVVVTMGCGDACPYIPGKRYVDWDLPDPAGQALDAVRATRDDIARRVGDLLTPLDAGA